jgi:hypothetical protein
MHLAYTVGKGRDGCCEVDVLHMKDFESWAVEHAVPIGVGASVASCREHRFAADRIRELASDAVDEDVEFDLPDAELAELLGQRSMGVVEGLRQFFTCSGYQLPQAWSRGDVVGVMRADHLDLIDSQIVAGPLGEAHGRK